MPYGLISSHDADISMIDCVLQVFDFAARTGESIGHLNSTFIPKQVVRESKMRNLPGYRLDEQRRAEGCRDGIGV